MQITRLFQDDFCKMRNLHKACEDQGSQTEDEGKLAALFSCCVGVLCALLYRFVLSPKRSTAHLSAFILLSFHSVAIFLLADTLLTWSFLLLGGDPKCEVSVCVTKEGQYKPPPSVYITMPHCGGTAVRKG